MTFNYSTNKDKEIKYSFISFLSHKRYLPGIKVLFKSLKETKTRFPLSIVILSDIFDDVKQDVTNISEEINIIKMDNFECELTNNEKKHYWEKTFFKLNSAKLTQFHKIVLLDLDLLICRNIDELFNYQHLSAAISGKILNPQNIWFNSGVLVIEPSEKYYDVLLKCLKKKRIQSPANSYGDQEIFRLSDPDWPNKKELHLPEEYNESYYCVKLLSKKLNNGFKDIKVMHFWGEKKPWDYSLFGIFVQYSKWLLKGRFDLIRYMHMYRKYMY